VIKTIKYLLMKANIITIGDEILIGQTVDTNSAWMGQVLNKFGISVNEIITVSDQHDAIHSALRRSLESADLILMTGGLGPTRDDITKKSLAAYFGSSMVYDDEIMKALKAYMESRGRELTEETMSLAMVPSNCDVIRNNKGTAAAMWFEEQETIVVSMPGVPYEMKNFMTEDVIPRLKERGVISTILHHTILTAGVGETVLADKIRGLEDDLPEHISLAYLPNLGTVKIRITGRGDSDDLESEIAELAEKITDRLDKYVFAQEDIRLEKAVGDLLIAKSATVGTAESCTGGFIAQQIVSVSGSSAYYQGSVVTYSYGLKEKLLAVDLPTMEEKGAVSEEVVRMMAKGALETLEVDYIIATSGIAGPGGGTPDKPVGTIWMAIGSKKRIKTKLFQLTPHRDINIPLSANLALNELRKFIHREEQEAES